MTEELTKYQALKLEGGERYDARREAENRYRRDSGYNARVYAAIKADPDKLAAHRKAKAAQERARYKRKKKKAKART